MKIDVKVQIARNTITPRIAPISLAWPRYMSRSGDALGLAEELSCDVDESSDEEVVGTDVLEEIETVESTRDVTDAAEGVAVADELTVTGTLVGALVDAGAKDEICVYVSFPYNSTIP